eukprot:CAMPEP_0170627450 /NCGR_PEP_ID=MMETSP0224-20130122/31980_1 /TAXON_ID=285029 /ORGANISM="Togula jolla, Strain CCCM 725" /LENGTH=80 /DNA_ID=CAMNT_0010954455 /DNA_START=42 /DNA_END=281 /DNA_ORIENTATION=-
MGLASRGTRTPLDAATTSNEGKAEENALREHKQSAPASMVQKHDAAQTNFIMQSCPWLCVSEFSRHFTTKGDDIQHPILM